MPFLFVFEGLLPVCLLIEVCLLCVFGLFVFEGFYLLVVSLCFRLVYWHFV